MKGQFSLSVFRNGEKIDEATETNLIVNVGRLMMAQHLGGDSAGRAIGKIGFGIGTGAAAPADSALTGAFVKEVTSITYGTTSDPYIEFLFVLDEGEANGMTITEFGLLNVAETLLFARRVRQPITKQEDIRFEGTWRITP